MNVFFYGLFMDEALLAGKGISPGDSVAGYVDGFALRIGERATLLHSAGARSYGVLMNISDDDLEALYADDSVADYVPETVIVQLPDRSTAEAVCYILPAARVTGTNKDYAKSLLELARSLGFPDTYLDQIRQAGKHGDEIQKNYEIAARLLSEQNFMAAVIAGAVATLLAAVAYGITVATWAFSYGFAAAGVGIVIGLSMQFVGRGISTKFAVVATIYTLAGCVLGRFFGVVIGLAQATRTSPLDVFRDNSLSVLADRTFSDLSLTLFVYWFVAVFCAVFFARRALSRADRLALGLYGMKA